MSQVKKSPVQVKKSPVRNLAVAAMMLALCLLLPFITMQIPAIGKALCPMHIPVLLCGFVCGPAYAAVIGLIAPLLRSILFAMPAFYPTAVAMAFELATYGLVSGLMYKLLRGRRFDVFLALIPAMLAGRVVWGLVMLILSGLSGTSFTFQAFIAGAFTTAIPGIICHLLLIPLIVYTLRNAKMIK